MTARCPTCGQTTGSLGDLTDAERDELVMELADAMILPIGQLAQKVSDAGGVDAFLADSANAPVEPVNTGKTGI